MIYHMASKPLHPLGLMAPFIQEQQMVICVHSTLMAQTDGRITRASPTITKAGLQSEQIQPFIFPHRTAP